MPDTSGRFKLVDHITNSRILDSDKPDNLSALLDRRHFIGLTAAAVVTALTSVGALNILSPSFAFATPTAAEKQAEADEVRRKLDDWGEQLNKASDDYYNALDAHDLAV
ncbi:MAG: twin-arginine translocation signal domain-containing protein, partial [Coriobacteriales bacterium]|nr:twin-arginine translocation signal domain-containing protein [Coriobacteriales bacterium]